MISFIVIGRNEGWKLSKSLDSVFSAIEYNNIRHSEVIYVDSKSTDDSLAIAKSFENVKIFEITGECNAAIARNIGAKVANGDWLFFLDGDMELECEFLRFILYENVEQYEFLTGHIIDHLYDEKGNFIETKERTYSGNLPMKKEFISTCGGVFVIKKSAWDNIGGMNSKFKINEDLDFSIRLRECKIKLLRLPMLIVKHHTVDYRNIKRFWGELKKFQMLYTGVFFRKHFYRIHLWPKFIRSYYTAFILLGVIASTIINNESYITSFLIIILMVLIMIRSFKHFIKAKVNRKNIFFPLQVILQIISDAQFILGIILFYPKPYDLTYKKIR